jgi:hypothetical protein
VLTRAGRLIASLRGAERLALAAVQFEKSRCGAAWARWSGKSSLSDVAPDSAEKFLLATTDLEPTTARRRAHTLCGWLDRFQREAGAEWKKRRSRDAAATSPPQSTRPVQAPDPDDQVWDEDAVKGAVRFLVGMPLKPEGERKLIIHFLRERNPEVRRRFLRECEKRGGLRCRACGVDPGERYGTAFARVLEVHHLLPLGLGVRETKLEHLTLLCPSCHRVVHHRREDPIAVEDLSALLCGSRPRGRKRS